MCKTRNESRTPCLALAGPLAPSSPAIATTSVAKPLCADCSSVLTEGNTSCIPGFCQACFANNVVRNDKWLKREHGCLACSCAIDWENKSPVPQCCFSCWAKQENETERLAQQKIGVPMPDSDAVPVQSASGSSESPPPLPPPDCDPASEKDEADFGLGSIRCADCRTALEPSNQSCVSSFCVGCFEENVKKNQEVERAKREEALKVKPDSVSWCTWYQKVASTVGLAFDGSVIPGRTALEQWKGMAEEERSAWKASFRKWSGACSPSPKKKKRLQSPESTEKIEPPVKRLAPVAGPQLCYEVSVASLSAFHHRWSWLQKKMGSEPSSSFFLKHSQEFHELYLDVLALLKAGLFSGSLACMSVASFGSCSLVEGPVLAYIIVKRIETKKQMCKGLDVYYLLDI